MSLSGKTRDYLTSILKATYKCYVFQLKSQILSFDSRLPQISKFILESKCLRTVKNVFKNGLDVCDKYGNRDFQSLIKIEKIIFWACDVYL